jgi:hypothetical protein
MVRNWVYPMVMPGKADPTYWAAMGPATTMGARARPLSA